MKIEESFEGGIKIVKYIYEDSDYSTEDQRSLWKDICKKCEFNLGEKCEKCDCLFDSFMQLKESKCPELKW